MEQIYYTQCPMGYGLGASNGFQIKRKTDNFPVSSDFRHLGLRAFPGGGRSLAPATLRYRQSDDHIEVAFLSPRPFEYETERGLWGRPGGHFAHGILLTREEFDQIDHWPAGLLDSTFWQRNDPVPTRGQEPHSRELTQAALIDAKNLWTSSIKELLKNEDLIARVITALVKSAHESRTLFVIDEGERLASLVALLTWIFPRSIRGDLTFSTFHDRPEELPGYRIQGTTFVARPNRALLLTQGFVLDTKLGTLEPSAEPAAWSRVIAGWMRSQAFDTLTAWGNVLDLAGGVPAESRWDSERFAMATAFFQGLTRQAEGVDWNELRAVAEWIPESPLRDAWADAHPPTWWLAASSLDADGRAALLRQATFKASWKAERASGWGRVVAQAFAETTPMERESAVLAFIKSTPVDSDRVEFLRALRDGMSPAGWSVVRKRLETVFPANSKTLAVLAVAEAVAAAAAGRLELLQALVDRFRRGGDGSVILLRVIAAEVSQSGQSVGALSESLRPLFAEVPAIMWALRQKDPDLWLGATFRMLFAISDSRDEWERLRQNTPADLKPALAEAVLSITAEEGLAEESFVWAIEQILMNLPETDRPIDPRWPGLYLDRSTSDLQLISRVLGRESPGPQLRAWLNTACAGRELDSIHKNRWEHICNLAKTLSNKVRAPLNGIDLRQIPREDRGPVLGRWLSQGRSNEAVFDLCGGGWAESFQPGSSDLSEMAKSIAQAPILRSSMSEPKLWLQHVLNIRRRVQVNFDECTGMSHDGLVAHIVASATDQMPRNRLGWAILEYLLEMPFAWRTVGEAFRLDLARFDPTASGEILETWTGNINMLPPAGSHFWEMSLNMCDDRRLTVVVTRHCETLATFKESISWWDHEHEPGSVNDMRDGFARKVPLSRIDEATLASIITWFNGHTALDKTLSSPPASMSERGRFRWDWIVRLSREIYGAKLSDANRSWNVFNWKGTKLDGLSLEERYQLIASVIIKIKDYSAFQIPPVANWLVLEKMTDFQRIKSWYNELDGGEEIPDTIRRERSEFVDKLWREMKKRSEELLLE